MKKVMSVVALTIGLSMYTLQLNAGIFDWFCKKAAETAVALRLKTALRPEKFQTPSDMLPLSEYHCIGTKYTNASSVNNLARPLAAGVRYFEFDAQEGIGKEELLGFKVPYTQKQIVTVGKERRELTSVIAELNSLLHKNQYDDEIVFIKLNTNNPSLINFVNLAKLRAHVFTPDDRRNELPLLADLRNLDKRIMLLIDMNIIHYEGAKGFWNLKRPIPKIINFTDNVRFGNAQSNINWANIANRAAVGCDYFPKGTRSFLSPHFNMYQYVGMDYTGTTSVCTISRDLAFGIRGFIFNVKQKDNTLVIDDNTTSLVAALNSITTFAKAHNEIVVVHLKNAAKTNLIEAQFFTGALVNKDVLFKPTDRLADAKQIPLYGQILKKYADTETGAKPKQIWPRLTWNYTKHKLVQITYDGHQDTENLWAAAQYYDHNTHTIRHSNKQLFYSDIIKPERKFVFAVTGAVAIALATLFITQNLTAISTVWQAIESKAYEAWGRISIQAAAAKLQGAQAEQDFAYSMMGLALGVIAIAQVAIETASGTTAALGLYVLDKTKKTFTVVREGYVIFHPIAYVRSSISELIQRNILIEQLARAIGTTAQVGSTKFDDATQYNLENFAAIDKLNMGWALRVAHTIRKFSAAKG